MFHIADIKKYRFCTRFFWYHKNDRPLDRIPFIRIEEKMTELAREKFKITDYFWGERNDTNQISLTSFEQHEWGFHVRWQAANLRIQVPLMHKTLDGYHLYFTFLGGLPKRDDSRNLADHLWVLAENGIEVCKISVLHFNPHYVRQEHLDIDELLVVSDTFYNAKSSPTEDMTIAAFQKVQDLSETLALMEETLQADIPKAVKLPRCYRRMRCGYYPRCFPDEVSESNDSIWTLVNSGQKDQFIKKGITRLDQLTGEEIDGDRVQYAQIMAARNQGIFVDKMALKNWLDHFAKPYAFLDFEWDMMAIPPYQGLKPMEVIPFQYSLHLLNEQELTHHQFLGMGDCRLALIEQLLKDVPDYGTIFAYNADGAEKLRLLELARQFPQHEKALQNIAKRLVDIAQPLFLGLYYDIRLKGSFTLKKVIEIICPELAYHDLAIQHGLEAVMQWRQADQMDLLLSEDSKEELFAYCQRDTLAMVKMIEYFKNLVK